VLAQLLTPPRPTDLLETVRHLELMQADTTAVVARSADLVAWTRLGSEYRIGDLDMAFTTGTLVELQGMLRPAADLALYRAEMAVWPGHGELREWEEAQRDWVAANGECRRDILDRLTDDGPLPARSLADTTVVPWKSSGWNDDRNVRMLVNLMVRRGEVAMAGLDGRERLWDLAERVYPDDPVVPLAEALCIRDDRRLRSLGIARARGFEHPVAPDDLDLPAVGEPSAVEGTRGKWRVDPVYLDQTFSGRAALLSPLDRLVFDRQRMVDLFEFDYQLEMYKPAAKRKWGYWALPILYGDRLVGKLDATADRDAGVLRVDAVHEDGDWSKTMHTAVDQEIDDLAGWLGLSGARLTPG